MSLQVEPFSLFMLFACEVPRQKWIHSACSQYRCLTPSTALGYLSDIQEGPKELQEVRLEISSILASLITLQDQVDQENQNDSFSTNSRSVLTNSCCVLVSFFCRMTRPRIDMMIEIGSLLGWPILLLGILVLRRNSHGEVKRHSIREISANALICNDCVTYLLAFDGLRQ